MIKKRIYLIGLIVFITLASACSKNESIVETVLRELTKSEWNGRQVGTEENRQTGEYLANILSTYGFQPFDSNGYFQTYEQELPDIDTLPAFRIINKDSVEELLPGTDFVINRGVSSFSFKGKYVINPTEKGDGSRIALYDNFELALNPPEGYPIILRQQEKFMYKANGKNLKMPYPIDISAQAYEKLVNAKNADLEICYEPVHKRGEVSNIIGLLKGTDNKKALILSAHFDGTASYGSKQLESAYDNGSGSAALAEVGRLLSVYALKKPFNMDIVICFFNGEETDLAGSQAFVSKLEGKYESMFNINVDCIGGKTCGPLAMKPVNVASEVLYEEVWRALKESNIPFNKEADYGNSDQNALSSFGMPVLVFGQEDVFSLAHTEEDRIENVDIKEIDAMAQFITQFVIKSGNKDFTNKNAVLEDITEAEWEAIQLEAERLTENISLKFNEIFVFDYKNKRFSLSGNRPLLSEEEFKQYYPQAQFPDLSSIPLLEGYTLNTVGVMNENAASLIETDNEQLGKISLELDMEKLLNVALTYTKPVDAKEENRIVLTFSKTESTAYGNRKTPLDGQLENYTLIENSQGQYVGFTYKVPGKEQIIGLEYYKCEPITVEGEQGVLIKEYFKDKQMAMEYLSAFDLTNKGAYYFEKLFGME